MHTYPVLHPLLFSLPYSNSHAGRRVRHPNECPPLHGARRRPFPPLPGAVLGGSGGDGDGEAREAAVSSQVPRVLVIGLMGCVYSCTSMLINGAFTSILDGWCFLKWDGRFNGSLYFR